MKLFYRTLGQGHPLVVLHGLLGMSDNWVTFAKKMAEHFLLILPDLRNHGNSPHSDNFNLSLMAEDVEELMEEIGINSCNLIGHSMGGRVAMELALNNSRLIHKLVIVDIAPRRYFGNKNIINLFEVLNRIDPGKISSISQFENILKSYVSDLKMVQFVLKNIKRTEQGVFQWKMNFRVLYENLETMMTPVFVNKKFDKQTLFIQGGKSDFILPDDYHLIKDFFPMAEIRVLPNAGHWVHADEPELFFKEVNQFLLF